MHLCIIYVSFCLLCWTFSMVQTDPLIRAPKPGVSTVFPTLRTCVQVCTRTLGPPPSPSRTLNREGEVCAGRDQLQLRPLQG